MFKLMANAGRWADIYIAPTAGDRLRDYAPKAPGFQGLENGIYVWPIIRLEDASRWGNRPRFVMLAAENVVIGHIVESSILLHHRAALETLAAAPDLEEARHTMGEIREACAELAQRVAPRPKPAASQLATHLTRLSWVISTLALLASAVALYQRPQNGKDGTNGKDGAPGTPGIAGVSLLASIREHTNDAAVGEFVSSQPGATPPRGFLECTGAEISREDYREYFEAMGITTPTTRLPRSPKERPFIVRVK